MPSRAKCCPGPHAPGDCPYDVHGTRTEGRTAAAKVFFQARRNCHASLQTGEPVFWPAPSALTTILIESPPHNAITLCANSYGRPWTESGFRASWATVRRKLEKIGRVGPGLTLYGLRHTVAV